jgi:hypothetical protein
MFTKLNINNTFSIQEERELKYQFGIVFDDVWYGNSYYAAEPKIESELKNKVPEKYRDLFEATLMIITSPYIPPHIDDNIKFSVNFYMETDDAITYFHKIKDNVIPNIEKLPEQTTGKLFEPKDLEIVGQFKANKGDVYILGVGEIHSVQSGRNHVVTYGQMLDILAEGGILPVYRTAYCLQSHVVTYDQMLDILAEGGILSVNNAGLV